MNSFVNYYNMNGYNQVNTISIFDNRYQRPLSQITNNIYLGNIKDAKNINNLIKLGIKKYYL